MHKIVDFARDTLGVKLFPGQAAALSEYYESDRPNWLFLAGRRSGKSLISDVICCFEALVPSFADALRPEEERYILIVSVRADNAALHIRQVAKLLRHNRTIGKMIKKEATDRIELSNNVTILSLPASARAGRGFTCSCLILDELAHYVDSMGNSSASAVYDALSPTVATFEHGRIVIASSVATKTGILYDLYERAEAGQLDDFYVTRTDTRSLNPKVSQRVIDNAMRRDPESASSEYLSEWRDPCENFLSSEAIDAAVDHGAREASKAEAGKVYVMGCDPATQRDRYAFVVMHKEKEMYFLDYARALKAPVDIASAEALLFDLDRRFHPAVIRCDTASTVQRLKPKISRLEYTPFSRPFKLKIYGSLKENLNLSQIVLYKQDDLLDELRALQIRAGADISAPKAGKIKHDDLADCLALCIDALASGKYDASNIGWFPDPTTVSWSDDPQGDERAEYENELIVKYELESGRPYMGRFHIHVEPHGPGEDWTNCKYRNSGCLSCFREYKQIEEENAKQFEGAIYTSAAQEIAEMRELRQRQRDEEYARERKTVSEFWRSVRSMRS